MIEAVAFLLPTAAPTYGWQKDGGSMRFTELGLIVTDILDNYDVI